MSLCLIYRAAGLIRNLTRSQTYPTAPYPEMVSQIIAAGGMINFVRQKLATEARRSQS